MYESCPYCGIGKLTITKRTHARVYGNTLIHIPNVPTRKCDVCGQYFFEDAPLSRVELLIGTAGPPPNRYSTHSEPVAKAAPGDNPETLHNRPK